MYHEPSGPPGGPGDKRLSQAEQLLECATAAVPFSSTHGQACVSLPLGPDGQQVFPLRSDRFRDWLVNRFYSQYELPPDDRSLRQALRTLEARAHCSGQRLPVERRIAAVGPGSHPTQPAGRLVLDLANDQGEVVEITGDAWQVAPGANVYFRHSRGKLSLPRPAQTADPPAQLDALRSCLNLASEAPNQPGPSRRSGWLRCLAWLLAALRPTGPYPILILNGPPGSAKSTAARLLRALVDPSTAPLCSLPSNERELLTLAWHAWVLAFDHVARISPRLSSALCRLSTGNGFGLRERYDEREALRFHLQRPIILTVPINGRPDFTPRPDLAARALTVELPPIQPEHRRTEADLWSDFEQARPGLLGALCTALSAALRGAPPGPGATRLQTLPFFADAAAWAVAAAPALGVSQDEMLAALAPAPPKPADPVVLALCDFIRDRSDWAGPATELLALLQPAAGAAWPRTPKGLSQHLIKLAPSLEAAGVRIELSQSHGRRRIKVAHLHPPSATPNVSRPQNQSLGDAVS